jgi:hypothetical protein
VTYSVLHQECRYLKKIYQQFSFLIKNIVSVIQVIAGVKASKVKQFLFNWAISSKEKELKQ